jgi:hypothetical protein
MITWLDADSPLLGELSSIWERHLLDGVAQLPYVSLDEIRAGDVVDPG